MSWSSSDTAWIDIALLEEWKCRDYDNVGLSATERLEEAEEMQNVALKNCHVCNCCMCEESKQLCTHTALQNGKKMEAVVC